MDSEQAIALVLFLTGFCGYINYKFIKLPKAIGITLVALLISSGVNILSVPYEVINDYAHSVIISLGFNKTFIHGMLSFLLFAAAIHINLQELYKHKFFILGYATISVIISTVLIGYATYSITIISGLDIPFYYCFVFGALISPTDALAILAVLRTTKISKHIEMRIAGESLFNDGMAIILFFMALALATGSQKSIHPDQALLFFLREAVGGILFGILLGWLAIKLLKDIRDPELMITLTLVLVTGGYIVAYSLLYVSGPLSMVVAGLMLGQQMQNSPNEALQELEKFWILTDEILNAILFVLIGIEFVWIDITIPIALTSMALIIVTLAARWISIYIPEYLLNKRENFNSKLVTILTWSGLRGGISIALALGLNQPYGDTIVAITYFIVLFSIIFQGLTIKPLISRITPDVVVV